MSPNQIDSRSRSAASPALPTAITTRPQLASSPAIAVFTSGELAMDSAMRLAAASVSAPSTWTVISLVMPSPSLMTCKARSRIRSRSASEKRPSAGSSALSIGAPPGDAVPVAKASSVSLVDVSLSTVMALKVVSTWRLTSAWSAGAATAASVKMKASMVAMSGAIMPEPLAMPFSVTFTPPISAMRVASLGKVSVVMMVRAASAKPSSTASAASSPSTASNLPVGIGSPMTPVEARNTSARRSPPRRRRAQRWFRPSPGRASR